MLKKPQFILLILAALLIVGSVSYGAYYFWQKPVAKVSQKACTEEAKFCPDGSAVGRVGPNCEFAFCPAKSISDPTANWQTYTGNGFEFKYPENFGDVIWHAVKWPPEANASFVGEEEAINKACPDALSLLSKEDLSSMYRADNHVIINNIDFRLIEISDGAAGSIYTNYCYATEKDQQYYAIQFIVKRASGCAESCGPYCGTEYEAACFNFDIVKEVEKPIEQIVSTFRFIK